MGTAQGGTKNLLILAGEDSGDLHGAELVRELLKHPGIRVYAYGGQRMQKAGAHLLKNTMDTAVVGVFEVLKALPRLLSLQKRIRQWVVQNLPQAVIMIDYPGFHMRQLSHLAGLVSVFYYIPPKVWAWKPGRARLLLEHCRRIYTIFPFENRYFPGENTRYFGHPLMDTTRPSMNKNEFLNLLGLKPSERLVGLLPGSRKMEVRTMLPEFLKTAESLSQRHRDLVFAVARPTSMPESFYTQIRKSKLPIRLVENQSLELIGASHLILATSGTVTLEAAILKTPMLICNKVHPITKFAFDKLAQTRWVGLPNIIAGREISPEFLQQKMKAEELFTYASRLLADDVLWQHQVDELEKVVKRLGEPGVVSRVAGDMVASL